MCGIIVILSDPAVVPPRKANSSDGLGPVSAIYVVPSLKATLVFYRRRKNCHHIRIQKGHHPKKKGVYTHLSVVMVVD